MIPSQTSVRSYVVRQNQTIQLISWFTPPNDILADFLNVIPKLRTRLHRFIYPIHLPIFNILVTLSQLVTLTNDALPINLTPGLNVGTRTIFMESFQGNVLLYPHCMTDNLVRHLSLMLVSYKSLHFTVISVRTMPFTWLETPMSEEISDIFCTVLVPATDLLTAHRFRVPIPIDKLHLVTTETANKFSYVAVVSYCRLCILFLTLDQFT